MTRKCRTYDAKFKAQVALEALQTKGELIEISTRHNIPRSNINEWKDKLIEEARSIFVLPHEKDKYTKQLKLEVESLHKIIGEITIENNFLKKKLQR